MMYGYFEHEKAGTRVIAAALRRMQRPLAMFAVAALTVATPALAETATGGTASTGTSECPDCEPVYAVMVAEYTDPKAYQLYIDGERKAHYGFPIEGLSVDDTPVVVEGSVKGANRFAISKFRSMAE